MLLLLLMKVNRFRITRSSEKLRINVPLVRVIWIALMIEAYTASTSLETQLGGTNPEQFHNSENLDDNLEPFVHPSTVLSCPLKVTRRCMD